MSRAEAVAKGQEELCRDGIRCAVDELPWRWMLAVPPRRPRATGACCCATGPCAEGWKTAAEPERGRINCLAMGGLYAAQEMGVAWSPCCPGDL